MMASTEAPRPRAGLANAGLVCAVTSFIPTMLLSALPPWTCTPTEKAVRVALLSGSLLWLAASFVLPGVALLRARHSPERYGGAGQARVGLAVAVLLCLVASIVTAGVIRHPPRWGESAIAEIRSFVSAEQVFFASSAGAGDGTPDCLTRPAECIPGYTGPEFLDSTFLMSERRNYRFTFYPGPPADATILRERRAAPTSVLHFAYVAAPLCPEVSPRSFCGNESGVICRASDGTFLVKDGRCPEACEPFQ